MHSKATLRPRENKKTQFIQLQVKSKMVKSRAVNPHWYTLDTKKGSRIHPTATIKSFQADIF